MYSKREIKFLEEVTNINHEMDVIIELVNVMNVDAMKIVAKKDPENLSPEMVVSLAKAGIDVRELNPMIKEMLPGCLDIDEEILRKGQIEMKEIKDKMKKAQKKMTGNVVHDDDEKRAVIFINNKMSDADSDKLLDEFYDEATARDIRILDRIVNEKAGKDKLHAWIESGVIDYIIMDKLEDYSLGKASQFFFEDKARIAGIKILLKANGYNPVIPY